MTSFHYWSTNIEQLVYQSDDKQHSPCQIDNLSYWSGYSR
ncbi:hypothetical protein AB691_0788 [Stutzerimonas stutzeri]|nr:hypothetical protein AB691_0788 [Stutzerimonas stutzeri]